MRDQTFVFRFRVLPKSRRETSEFDSIQPGRRQSGGPGLHLTMRQQPMDGASLSFAAPPTGGARGGPGLTGSGAGDRTSRRRRR